MLLFHHVTPESLFLSPQETKLFHENYLRESTSTVESGYYDISTYLEKSVVKSRALELEPGAGAPRPGFFRGAGAGFGALCEIQVELEPELESVV